MSIFAALTVFVVVQVDSLKATSLTGRFSKPINQTSNSSSTTTSTQVPANDQQKVILDEVPEDDDGVSRQTIIFEIFYNRVSDDINLTFYDCCI